MHVSKFINQRKDLKAYFNTSKNGCEKTQFSGNLSTMRRHCARYADTHLDVYRKGCLERGIKMHETCLSNVNDNVEK